MKTIFLIFTFCPSYLFCQAQVWSGVNLEYYLPFKIEELCNKDSLSKISVSHFTSKGKGKKEKWKYLGHKSVINFHLGKRSMITNYFSENFPPDTIRYVDNCISSKKHTELCCNENLVYCYNNFYEFTYDDQNRLVKTVEKSWDVNNWSEFIYTSHKKIPIKENHYFRGELGAIGYYFFDSNGRLKEIKCYNSSYSRFISFDYDDKQNTIEIKMGFNYNDGIVYYWQMWLVEY